MRSFVISAPFVNLALMTKRRTVAQQDRSGRSGQANRVASVSF
jgi:hypothetical protein